MTAPRWARRAAAVTAALAALAATAAAGYATATATAPPPCPAAASCPVNPVIITDHAPGMAAPFTIEDSEGKPPGQNAPMFWVDGFQAGSVNPVCADATVPYLAHEACLGGNVLNATGGHPVLALCLRLAGGDCAQWEVLTPADIALLHAVRRAGLTPRDLAFLARFAHARESRR